MRDQIFVLLQQLLPKRLLSDLTGWLTRLHGGAVTRVAIRVFCRLYGVDMAEAASPNPASYATFNAFFTRELHPGARPQPVSPLAAAAPADGMISETGLIQADRMLQAKGVSYSLAGLLGGDAELAAHFTNGWFQTTYLAPYNYHRVHMPLGGTARAIRYMPGDLYSVNAATTRLLPDLFCRNERVAVVFDCKGGQFAMVMVGALNVGSIELVLPATDPFNNRPAASLPGNATVAVEGQALQRGAEFGRFNMGSTVVLLTSPGLLRPLDSLVTGCRLQVGQTIGRLSD